MSAEDVLFVGAERTRVEKAARNYNWSGVCQILTLPSHGRDNKSCGGEGVGGRSRPRQSMLTRRLPVFSELAKGNPITHLTPTSSWDVSDTAPTAPSALDDIAVYTFGDSQAEVLDYVFHADPSYRTWKDRRVGWRSGWSARGLYLEANLQRMLVPLSNCPAENAVVFLTFGSTDIDINLAYKRYVKGQGDLDVDRFVEEMTTNLWNSVLRLRAMNADPAIAANIYVCLVFPYVPLPTTQKYWNETFGNNPTPHHERVALYESFIKKVCERGDKEAGIEMNLLGARGTAAVGTAKPSRNAITPFVVHVLNVREAFESAGGFQVFQRKSTTTDGKSTIMVDHHPDYIATQTIVADKIREMGLGLEPKPPLKSMFPHVPRDMHTYSVIPTRDYYYSNDKAVDHKVGGIVCFNCNMTGHRSKDCTGRQGRGGGAKSHKRGHE